MKFKFKIQDYQTDAVKKTIAIFNGQPNCGDIQYRRDLGKTQNREIHFKGDDDGYRNSDIKLTPKQILENLHEVQKEGGIPLSTTLSKTDGLGAANLDIEMETGTGKTYVYIKTMFELNKQYGWSKFIIVVPSIAIREGVAKSFQMLEEHFMESYGKKARWFIYNSSNLTLLDHFSQDAGLNVMVINTQAFAASLKENGRSKESRIIYSKRDEFASRRPIDVIAANRPIIIMDEPQKMEGVVTQIALKKFNPLFVLNYSATHKTKHDTVYALDALDAYRERLVKRIKVIGFEMKNLRGVDGYMHLDDIVLSPKKPPMARISIEVKNANGEIRRQLKTFEVGDSLFIESNEMNQYKEYTVDEIFPGSAIQPTGYVTLTNGIKLCKGIPVGNTNELHMQRLQIRETIKAHFEKERDLFKKGIKCLSLFFIDEVAKYRSYDEEGNPVKGIFQTIFEEEYARFINEAFDIWEEEYTQYLRRFEPEQVHRGYFSIDKKGKMINTKTKRGSDISDDASDYDLILRDKERLLSFEEPTRFIFSHSALREGWDNPNVFQICALRQSNSTIAKRQEVGRGLRICVDCNGIRQDKELLGEDVHDINVLTVIANESYSDFTNALQRETREALRVRTLIATLNYFEGKKVIAADGEVHVINSLEAMRIMVYLEDNGYVDSKGNITPKYHADVASGTVAPYCAKLESLGEGITQLINAIFDPSLLNEMTEDGAKAKLPKPKLNVNFAKPEFQALWEAINHQYVYTVSYDTNELIKQAVQHLNGHELQVRTLGYIKMEGQQNSEDVTQFGDVKSSSQSISTVSNSTVKYDLIGQVAKGANITRRTAAKILQGMNDNKLSLFRTNPEEFLRKVVQIISEQKATMIVDHIHYHMTEGKYASDIFTVASYADSTKAYEAIKHITDYVVTDSQIERDFAKELDGANEVVVYAKLPRSFKIPTPVGNYAPDWAIAMQKGEVKHIFFIAETKGSLQSMQLNAIENAKIDCCSQLFEELSTDKIHYHKVTCYQDLLNAMTSIQ